MKKPKKIKVDDVRKKLQEEAGNLWKKYCRVRDDFKCVLCGSQETLQVHHIFSRKNKGLFLDVENGCTLCRDCHCSVTFNDTAKDSLRRKIDPATYDRLYEQSKIGGPFLEWKNISWLEQQIAILQSLTQEK